MFGFAWLTLRQAQEALKNGRLEEALRLLGQPGVRNHRRDRRAARPARPGLRRARRTAPEPRRDRGGLARPAPGRGAGDGGEDARPAASGAGRGWAWPSCGRCCWPARPARAEEAVTRLRQRQVAATELGVLEEGLRGWLRAQGTGRPGRVGPGRRDGRAGRPAAGRQRALRGVPRRPVRDISGRCPTCCCGCTRRRAASAGARCWSCAEQVLAHRPGARRGARALRTRAWRALEPATVAAATARTTTRPPLDGAAAAVLAVDRRRRRLPGLPGHAADVRPGAARRPRGRAAGRRRVAAARHAGRDGEGYVLEAVRPMQVNGADGRRRRCCSRATGSRWGRRASSCSACRCRSARRPGSTW